MEIAILASIMIIAISMFFVPQSTVKNLLLLAVEVLTAMLCHFHRLHTLAFVLFLLALLTCWSLAIIIARFDQGKRSEKKAPSFIAQIGNCLGVILLLGLVCTSYFLPFQLKQVTAVQSELFDPRHMVVPIASGIIMMLGMMTLVFISNRKEK